MKSAPQNPNERIFQRVNVLLLIPSIFIADSPADDSKTVQRSVKDAATGSNWILLCNDGGWPLRQSSAEARRPALDTRAMFVNGQARQDAAYCSGVAAEGTALQRLPPLMHDSIGLSATMIHFAFSAWLLQPDAGTAAVLVDEPDIRSLADNMRRWLCPPPAIAGGHVTGTNRGLMDCLSKTSARFGVRVRIARPLRAAARRS